MKTEEIVDSLSTVLDQINSLIRKEFTAYNIDLTASQICVLRFILKNGGQVKVSEIVLYLKKNKSTITEIIKKLEKFNYITKLKCDKDKRELYLKATDKLLEEEELINRLAKKVLDTIYQDFTDGEKLLLTEMLGKLSKNLTN